MELPDEGRCSAEIETRMPVPPAAVAALEEMGVGLLT